VQNIQSILCLNLDGRHMLVKSTVLPIINYACLVWFHGTWSHQNWINRMYRWAAKYVLQKQKFDNVTYEIYNRLNWFNCKYKYMFECAKLMYNINLKKCIESFYEYVDKNLCTVRSTRRNYFVIQLVIKETNTHNSHLSIKLHWYG